MRLVVFVVFSVLIILVSSAGLKEEFTWTRIDYVWPVNAKGLKRETHAQPRYRGGFKPNPDAIVFEDNLYTKPSGSYQISNPSNNAIGSIDYQYENNIPLGANVWKNKLFITVPRRRLGIPSTLNYVLLDSPNKHNTPLIPYPNWKMNIYPDPNQSNQNFVSVYRVAIDSCDRLWFVDTGILEVPGNPIHAKPTTIVVMDLNRDEVINTFQIPEDQLTPTTTLASIVVDLPPNNCEDAFAYMPDLGGYGLIVYSLKENRSWRITHNFFYLEPAAGEFFISGHHFQWNDGIFSVELTDIKSDGSRDLYFHSMAGTNMYSVSTKVLKNEMLATRTYHENDFKVIGDRGPLSQTSSADIHKPSGIMFLALVNQNALACWNVNEPLNSISIVQKNDDKMIYPCDVKVYKDKVYVLTNTMPEFLYGHLNYDQVNFRVWSNTVAGAVDGTRCVGYRKGVGVGRY